jgi:hypothetical protein
MAGGAGFLLGRFVFKDPENQRVDLVQPGPVERPSRKLGRIIRSTGDGPAGKPFDNPIALKVRVRVIRRCRSPTSVIKWD